MLMLSYDRNKRYYEEAAVAELYGSDTGLTIAERAALALVREEAEGVPLLDIGVGAGRTTPYLRELSGDYLGIDYSDQMIGCCRARFPDAAFMVCDARRMTAFENARFGAAFYWFNGLDEVAPEDRRVVFGEIHRVLRRAGLFIFSSHNLAWEGLTGWRLPRRAGRGLLGTVRDGAAAAAAHVASQLSRGWSRLCARGYAIILEYEHHAGVVLPTYYATRKAVDGELRAAGFTLLATIGSDGLPATDRKPDRSPWLYYVARKT